MDLTLLADLWDFFSVEKHAPGKLVLKVDLAVRHRPEAAALSGGTAPRWPAIRKTRMNIFTRTLTVEYDTTLLPFDRLDALLRCDDRGRMRSMAKGFAA